VSLRSISMSSCLQREHTWLLSHIGIKVTTPQVSILAAESVYYNQTFFFSTSLLHLTIENDSQRRTQISSEIGI
jgi:hypothetical protein